jgi:hypothetical protein
LKFRRTENQSRELNYRIIDIRRIDSRQLRLRLWLLLLLLRPTQARAQISTLEPFLKWIGRRDI